MKHMNPSPLVGLLTASCLLFSNTALASDESADSVFGERISLELGDSSTTESSVDLSGLRLSGSTALLRELQKKPDTNNAEEALDPSDPLQFMNSGRLGLEFNDLANGEGRSTFFRVGGNFALNPKILIHADIPLGWSNLSHHSTDVGIGDLRLALYYQANRDRDDKKLFQGMMPGIEVILPSGKATDGLGGDAGLVIPYFNLQMKASETVTIYNIFRYVHSLSRYRPAGNPDINVPSATKGRDTQDGVTVREFSWQIPVTVKPEKFFLTWMTFTPDLAWNFHNKTTRAYRLDIEAGKSFKDDFSVAANLTLPLNNGNTINWIFGIQAIISF